MALYEITDRQTAINWECSDEAVKRTVQNAKNLMMCRMGDVPYDRQRGLNPAIYDMPVTKAREMLLPELDRVMLWEPNVEVVTAAISTYDGEPVITCVIEVKE